MAVERKLEGLLKEFEVKGKDYEEKIWSSGYEPGSSLSDILSKKTVSDLHKLRKRLEIEGASSLRKGELVSIIIKATSEKLLNNLLAMDEDRFELVKKAAVGGFVRVDEDFELHKAEYFSNMGILFPGRIGGRKGLVITSEVKDAFGNLDKSYLTRIVKKNTETVKILNGLVYNYGVMDVEQLYGKLRYYSEQEYSNHIDEVVSNAIRYYRLVSIAEGNVFHPLVRRPEAILSSVKERGAIDYYPFTKEELIQAGEEDYRETNMYLNLYIDFLVKNYGLSKEVAVEFAHDLVMEVKNDYKATDIIQMQAQRFQLPTKHLASQMSSLVINIINNTRLWVLKGHIPVEVRKNEEKSEKTNVVNIGVKRKVGRNEPCVCGSGQKYKKCCGR